MKIQYIDLLTTLGQVATLGLPGLWLKELDASEMKVRAAPKIILEKIRPNMPKGQSIIQKPNPKTKGLVKNARAFSTS
jgi:hypothetical protein